MGFYAGHYLGNEEMSVLAISEIDYRHQLRADAEEADRIAADQRADRIRKRWKYGYRNPVDIYNEDVPQYVAGKPIGETRQFTEKTY